MFYTENYTIQSLVCDATDHLNLWGLSRLFQEVAELHTFTTGIGYDSLIKQDKAWVLCRMLYDVKRMPKMWDRVVLTTWSRGTNGLFAVRDFKMELVDSGELLASATAYWAVIDFNTRHVTRLHDIMDHYEHHSDRATDVDELKKLRLPTEIQNPNFNVQHFRSLPSMIDHTHHVNNAEYLKWISNHCNVSGLPFRLQVDYVLETQLGEEVTIFKQSDNLSANFQICNSRGIAANVTLAF